MPHRGGHVGLLSKEFPGERYRNRARLSTNKFPRRAFKQMLFQIDEIERNAIALRALLGDVRGGKPENSAVELTVPPGSHAWPRDGG